MLILGVCFILYYLKLSGTNGLMNKMNTFPIKKFIIRESLYCKIFLIV